MKPLITRTLTYLEQLLKVCEWKTRVTRDQCYFHLNSHIARFKTDQRDDLNAACRRGTLLLPPGVPEGHYRRIPGTREAVLHVALRWNLQESQMNNGFLPQKETVI